MGRSAVVLAWVLLAGAVTASAHAQATEPAPGEPSEPPAATAPSGPEPATTDAADDPTQTGYEPDQRGAIEPGPQGAPEPQASMPSAGPPISEQMADSEASYDAAPDDAEDDDRDEPTFYLDLQNGYAFLDPAALSSDSSVGVHGYQLGLGAGLHLDAGELGLRFTHGIHEHGVDSNQLLLDGHLGLGDGALIVQLRLALGLLVLSDLPGASGALVGIALEPGIGARTFITRSFTLGVALDLGLSHVRRSSLDATGVELRLHLDAGLHF